VRTGNRSRLILRAPHPPLRAVAEALEGAGHTFGLLLLLPSVAAGADPIRGHVAVDVRGRLDGVDRVDVAGVELVVSLARAVGDGRQAAAHRDADAMEARDRPSLNAPDAEGAPLRLVQTGAFVRRPLAIRRELHVAGHASHHATASQKGATRTRPAQMPRCRAVIALPLSEIDQVGVRVAGYR
jgi:hypothetical protein